MPINLFLGKCGELEQQTRQERIAVEDVAHRSEYTAAVLAWAALAVQAPLLLMAKQYRFQE